MSTTVDYDQVAPTYDRRSTPNYLRGVRLALHELAQQINAQTVLDIGCGTGRSLRGLAAETTRRCYGLDFSAGMLAQAQRLEENFRLVQASGPWPPFQSGCFDLVICVLAFHHMPRQGQVISEAYRLLQPGGAFAIANVDPRDPELRWPIYDYFEGTFETDLDRYPAVSEKKAWLRQAGFQAVRSLAVDKIHERVVGKAILENYWLRKEATSQLVLLSDAAYHAGMERIREIVRQQGDAAILETHLILRLTYGFK